MSADKIFECVVCCECALLSVTAPFKGKITYFRIGNRGRDSKIMSGLLDNQKSILKEAMGEAS